MEENINLPEGFTMGGSMAGMKGMPSQEQAQVSKRYELHLFVPYLVYCLIEFISLLFFSFLLFLSPALVLFTTIL